MSMPVRVCLVAPLPPPMGGIARGVFMLREHARRAPAIELLVVDTAVRWRDVHDDSLRSRAFDGGRQLLTSAGSLLRAMIAGRADVVHLKSSGGLGAIRDVVLVTLARLWRRPVIYHLHFGRLPEEAARRSREWRLMARVMRRAGVVVVTDARTERAITSRLPGVRVERIPNGTELGALPDRPPARPDPVRTVLFVGWVLPSKGIEDLLIAWRQQAATGWRLLVAGPIEPAYRQQLERQFVDLDSVSFLGELPHPQALEEIANCDLFVLPSHTEAFPNVVVEAMACGAAVLSTDVGAVPEMLDGCGVVVPPRSPADLSAALAELMSDPDRRTALGERARAKAVREYGMDGVFARYLELWLRVGSSKVAVASPRVRDDRGVAAR